MFSGAYLVYPPNEAAPYEEIGNQNIVSYGISNAAPSHEVRESISTNTRGQATDKNNNLLRYDEKSAKRESDIDNMYSKVNPENKLKKATKQNSNLAQGTYGEVRMLENDIYNEQLPNDVNYEGNNKSAKSETCMQCHL